MKSNEKKPGSSPVPQSPVTQKAESSGRDARALQLKQAMRGESYDEQSSRLAPPGEPTRVRAAGAVKVAGTQPIVQATLTKGASWSKAMQLLTAAVTIRTDVPWEVVLDARGNLILIEHGAKASVELSATSERNLVIIGAASSSNANIDGNENVSIQSIDNKDLNVSLGGYRAFSVSVFDKGGAKGKS